MMEITINIPEWIAYIGVILIALWAADKTLLLVKKLLNYKLKRERKKSLTTMMRQE